MAVLSNHPERIYYLQKSNTTSSLPSELLLHYHIFKQQVLGIYSSHKNYAYTTFIVFLNSTITTKTSTITTRTNVWLSNDYNFKIHFNAHFNSDRIEQLVT